MSHIIQELVASNPSGHNWAGILIALVVITQVISMVLLAVYLITPNNDSLDLEGEKMTREDIEKEEDPCPGFWISGRMNDKMMMMIKMMQGDEYLCWSTDSGVRIHLVKTGGRKEVLSSTITVSGG